MGSGLGKQIGPARKNQQDCAGYLVSEPSENAGRRELKNWEGSILVGMPTAHETGLPITTVRPYQSRNDSAGTAHLSYGSRKRDSGAGSEHTAVTVDAIGLTTHRKDAARKATSEQQYWGKAHAVHKNRIGSDPAKDK